MNSTYEKSSCQSGLIRNTFARNVQRSVLISLTSSLLCVAAPWATATPLPAGTQLTITKDPGGSRVGTIVESCPTGSCFGMYLFGSTFAWVPIPPGTDGGIIIGKGQLSGGQEVNGLSTNDGELTGVWYYGNNPGTFFTAPSDAGNKFDDASCTGAGCIDKTVLYVWNTAWGGSTILMGSASGCNPAVKPACTADQAAGILVKSWTIDSALSSPRNYELKYNQVVPTVFPNYPYELILRGTVIRCVGTCASLSADKNNPAIGATVALTGTCTTANPVAISSCLISQSSGPTTVNTSGPTGTAYSQTRIDTFTPTQNGTYVFTLTTTDNVTPTAGTGTSSVTITVSTTETASQPSTSEGCSMVQGATVNPSERFDWWLVLGFIAWLGMIIRRRQQALV